MNWKNEWKTLAAFVAVFLVCFYLPVGQTRFDQAVLEALALVRWYAREHVLLCLVPAFFIAGAIAVFVSQSSVMRWLGPAASKPLAYGVAAVSGTILAVCSCTVLPLFAGIYRMGAGLGPAIAFLYSGPAINALAIILTANVLGWKLGVARAFGAILFSVVIGLCMHFIYRHEEEDKAKAALQLPAVEGGRPLVQTALLFFLMILVLVFANWARPPQDEGLWHIIWLWKWPVTSLSGGIFFLVLNRLYGFSGMKLSLTALIAALAAAWQPGVPELAMTVAVVGLSLSAAMDPVEENREWFTQSWGFAKLILPLLFWGVLVAGFLLGQPGGQGVIPPEWIARSVGGNSLGANFFAAFAGALMYFATLTEIPILQGLLSAGMGQGPALALLLAGPALSLPNMLVIRTVLGTGKTVTFVTLVVTFSTLAGWVYGMIN